MLCARCLEGVGRCRHRKGRSGVACLPSLFRDAAFASSALVLVAMPRFLDGKRNELLTYAHGSKLRKAYFPVVGCKQGVQTMKLLLYRMGLLED